MKIDKLDKVVIAFIIAVTTIEVAGTIALGVGAVLIIQHFLVKFW